MKKEDSGLEQLLVSLQERAKELNCLYQVEEILSETDAPIKLLCERVIEIIPPGWQYSDICEVQISLDGEVYQSANFFITSWVLATDIFVQDEKIGKIVVYYTAERPSADIGPFLNEEKKLIETIADRLGDLLFHRRMKQRAQEWDTARRQISERNRPEWQVVLDLLRQTDRNLFLSISHKMLNHLCWSGVREAEQLRQSASSGPTPSEVELLAESNVPHQKHALLFSDELSHKTFAIADEHLADAEIFNRIQKWIQEDKLSFLVQVVNRNLSLSEVADAIRRYHHLASEEVDIHSPNKRGVEVSLIRRFLSSQLNYINVAKEYIEVQDFYHLLHRVIFSAESQGKLGGKAAGLYLAAQILRSHRESHPELANVRIPRTWHITSDMLLQFMHYNNFDEVVEQKYKEINQVRLEYPHIVQTFKNSHMPPEILQGLSVALDEFGDSPLIVRSSSLLEDSAGAAFSGKYKSLFLANQGSKREKLESLTDAIAEVYASTFAPDPIEYRAERGLIDFGEEMGIMIQEVAGSRIGNYFLPAMAGVALSRNEFRWSPRIKREDSLVRLVPGLGTRAVDRLADDYPIMIAPGQPNLKVNVSVEEQLRYSPKMVDVINLETNSFETIEFSKLLRMHGDEIERITDIVSVFEEGHIKRPVGLTLDFEKDDLVVTFDGLIAKGEFVPGIRTMLRLLEEELGTPVDVEFAHDGKNFYLLQCRPQSHAADARPAPIPKDVAPEKVIFTANRFVSNGRLDSITHIVYVDAAAYGELSEHSQLVEVGRAVGSLNKHLPKRQFILIGPGRWGSRGDIKLGVNVTYSDINNAAMLIEVARKVGNYVPDLSFGTHFFQDLVEAEIRYLPLYPDDKGIVFNERFLQSAPNILAELLPDYAHLADTIRLIDVPKAANGQVLQVMMNADLDEAIALLASADAEGPIASVSGSQPELETENYWSWRYSMAEHIAAQLDRERYGVQAFYLFGSTKNGTAGPGSDIDILIHVVGSGEQHHLLEQWLDGWSRCLSEINFLRTGYRSEGLLDVHYVTDEDIANRTSYASKIGAVTDAATELVMGSKVKRD
jgi:hypothetical protein